jgi:hypothetical protein
LIIEPLGGFIDFGSSGGCEMKAYGCRACRAASKAARARRIDSSPSIKTASPRKYSL